SALWNVDLHLMARARRERFGNKRLLLNRLGQENQTRTRLVVIELGQECPQNLCRAERTVRLGEIGAIPPVLAGTEEENLNAGHAAFLMDGENVSLFDRLRIDALM